MSSRLDSLLERRGVVRTRSPTTLYVHHVWNKGLTCFFHGSRDPHPSPRTQDLVSEKDTNSGTGSGRTERVRRSQEGRDDICSPGYFRVTLGNGPGTRRCVGPGLYHETQWTTPVIFSPEEGQVPVSLPHGPPHRGNVP